MFSEICYFMLMRKFPRLTKKYRRSMVTFGLFGQKSLLRFVFLQETSLSLKTTQQTLVAKPLVYPSQHCPGHLMMGTCHWVPIKSVLINDHSWSCPTLQSKWKASTSVQQKTKLIEQPHLHIFVFLVGRKKRVYIYRLCI